MDQTCVVNEGFLLDDAGTLIGTSYVDLRDNASRTPIGHLVKGCRREHALEDSETILISPVGRFRVEGQKLIRDPQEGLARVETRVVRPLTHEQQLEERRASDLNEAHELLGSASRVRSSISHENVERSSGSLSYGHEWWIYSTAIAPETEEEWAALRASLDPAYDHESVIGQPAKFAEALGRMVAEQLGPQGKDGSMRSSFGGVESTETHCPAQWVIHGPVVYSDRLYETLTQQSDEAARIAAMLFTKSSSHTAMREYRFAILRDGTVDDTALLKVSGMMRDALRVTSHGLVRTVPVARYGRHGTGRRSSNSETTVTSWRESTTERVVRRQEMRSEVKGSDGQILSSDSTMRQTVEHRTESKDLKPEAIDGAMAPQATGLDAESVAARDEKSAGRDAAQVGTEQADQEVAKELALSGRVNAGLVVPNETQASQAHGDDVFKAREQLFARTIQDPATPIGAVTEAWPESALSAEEVRTIHGFGAALALKVTRVQIGNRRDVSSACWHAMQCIRNVVVRIGSIVKAVSIGRERFVVLELGGSEEAEVNGRIVVTPSGGYVYRLMGRNGERLGLDTSEYGTIWFPMDSDVTMFENAGWRVKGQP